MTRTVSLLCSVLLVVMSSFCHAADIGSADVAPREVVSLSATHAAEGGEPLILAGRDAAAQLVVMATHKDGRHSDVTLHVDLISSDANVVRVDGTGWITPVDNGRAIVTATHAGVSTQVTVESTHQATDVPVNFPNEVVPVFTKFGCNGGGCHGKSSGQNGFRLSLLGFEPQEDYEHLVRESRGRRIFPAAPHYSLLLRKAVGDMPHGGGDRFDVDSPPYRVLRRWIEQGMPYGSEDDPVVTHVEVLPRERVLAQHESQQLVVRAVYSDGSVKDVTRVAQYESGDGELAEANERGIVTAGELSGSVAVMVRFQTHVDVFRASVPLGVPVDQLPPEKNLIDRHVFEKLKRLGLPPSEVCDDATFIRRVTLDIAGRLPTPDETHAFIEDASANKREALVDRLLDSADYADYFASKWNSILRNRRQDQNSKYVTFAFHDWIRQSMLHNKPYDHFVREIISAVGQVERNPAVAWYHQVRDPAAQVEDAAQLFLGMRIQCARCHHHPAEKWSQRDYFGLSAYFSRVGRKNSKLGRGQDHIFHRFGNASAAHPKTGQAIPPTPLDTPPPTLDASQDPRQHLADWMTDPANPFFAKALVNRYWKHFFGRGLVEPEDDMRITNPPTHPALLDELAEHFVASGFDMKQLIRTMCTSSTYSLSAVPNDHNAADKQSFSRFYPRRLPAEVLLDAIDAVTEASSRFNGVPPGTRAVELPDNAFNSYFLRVFGRPESESACECERSNVVNLAQTLHLLNSAEIRGKTAVKDDDSMDAADVEQSVRELYVAAFSRPPSPQDIVNVQAHFEPHGGDAEKRKQAYEDLTWVLINTKEFLFNH